MPHRLRERYPPTNATPLAAVSRFRRWRSRTGSEDDDASSSDATRPSPRSPSASPFSSQLLSSFSSSRAGRSRLAGPKRSVRVSDQELARRALQSDAARALEQALARPRATWASARQTRDFTILSGRRDVGDAATTAIGCTGEDERERERETHEVLAVGEVACSPRELAAVLRAADESQLNASMQALHGRKFIYGSLVHVVDPRRRLLPREGDQLAVKTSCFARSRLLGRNEEWCFLEHFQRHEQAQEREHGHDRHADADADADVLSDFTVVQLSMREAELAAGKVSPNRRVEQLQGVTAVYRVEQVPGKPRKGDKSGRKSAPAARVTFHGLYTGGDANSCSTDADSLSSSRSTYRDEDGDDAASASASGKTAKARLHALAESVRRLPSAVRRRRLGQQVFADTAAMGEAKNARCISCTRSLHLLSMTVKRRCQLCSYNVCASCCSSEKVETYNGHATTMVICRRCLECVDRCDYSHIQLSRASPSALAMFDAGADSRQLSPTDTDRDADGGVDAAAAGGPDAAEARARPVGAAIVETLRQELQSEETKAAAITVISHLLAAKVGSASDDELDEEKQPAPEPDAATEEQAEPTAMRTPERFRSSSWSACSDHWSDAESIESDDWQRRLGSPEESVSAVEEYFRRREREAAALGDLGDSELSNASRRTYALELDADGVEPVAPVPSNERERLRAIERLQLMALRGPLLELDLICDVLSLEIGLFCTMVTIVGEREQLVLASTLKALAMARLPREHTFCQHLLMGDKPFVINNPEADVRFYNMNPITQNGVQFYCGIPIESDDGLVVGSICCLHLQPVHLTRAQLATLSKFGRIASRIVLARARQQRGAKDAPATAPPAASA